jgi:hypothetical protein
VPYWQNIFAAAILLLASFYLGKRGWHRLRVLLNGDAPGRATCGSAQCGGCESRIQPPKAQKAEKRG